MFLNSLKQSDKLFQWLDKIWVRYAAPVLLTGCFLLPLKLSFTYLCFGPVILLWSIYNRANLVSVYNEYKWFIYPWSCFIAALIINSLFGMMPYRSLNSVHGLIFYPLIIFAVADRFTGSRAILPLSCLLAGQVLAGLHSVMDAATKNKLPRLFLGEVTEAGQLALSIPLACGLAVCLHRFSKAKLNFGEQIFRASLVAASSFALLALPFTLRLSALPDWLSLCLVFILLLILVSSGSRKELVLNTELTGCFARCQHKFLLNFERFALPVLLAALVVNLKRGPWAGVAASLVLFMLIYSPRLVMIFLAAACTIFFSVLPVQQRLLESSRDFFIPGGRSDIWRVGIEIAERFPLGIGFRNSKFLHQYSGEIPKELTHFHNNLINILVEGGALSLILFIVWFIFVLKFVFSKTSNLALAPLSNAIGCAMVSWLIVGLFEYNFGDSEVIFVLYILLGAAAGIKSKVSVEENRDSAGS